MSIMQMLLGAVQSGYNLLRSVRFRASASAYLNRTPAVAGDRRTWTWSGWVKRGTLGVYQSIFTAFNGASNNDGIAFDANNNLQLFSAASNATFRLTSAVYRDPSAWYHIVVSSDTPNATAQNRARIWVNGVEVTAWITNATITQNSDWFYNSTNAHSLGRFQTGGYFDGYMAEVNFIDGQALTPLSFGSTNATTGVWQPAAYTGTYGTNGFYLPYTNSSISTYAGLFNRTTPKYLTVSNASTDFSFGTNAFTIECWVNLTSLPSGTGYPAGYWIFGGGLVLSNTGVDFYITSTQLGFNLVDFTSPTAIGNHNMVAGQWYHLAVVRGGTSNQTLSLYVNGVRVATATSVTATSDPALTGIAIGAAEPSGATSGNVDGYISNYRIVKGSAVYDPALTTLTVPSTNLTAITNTVLLTLQNATIVDNSSSVKTITNVGSTTTSIQYPFVLNIAADYSGNNNNWTPNNISLAVGVTYDSMTDVPTLTSATAANYAVLNNISNLSINSTLSNANLQVVTVSSGDCSIPATIGMQGAGKYYAEFVWTASGTSAMLGIIPSTYASGTAPGYNSNSAGYRTDGLLRNSGASTSSWGATWVQNDVMAIAFDAGAGTIEFYKNNVKQGSTLTGFTTDTYFFAVGEDAGSASATWVANFGQRPFSYSPPTGFVALNTFNLAASTIVKGNVQMDATLYTGNGNSTPGQNVVNAGGFQPDLVWNKSRSNTEVHVLFDSVRGSSNLLYSNLTNAEDTGAGNGFNSNGFLATATGNINTNGQSYVAWQWKAGGAAVTNTAGSISAQVSANASAGFSVVTYTGTGANATVGHGLGVAPKMIIVKQRNGTFTWRVYHASLANTQVLYLSATDAATTETTAWNSTTPTSSVFSVGTSSATNGNTNTYVAYCWSEIAGYSKFGSYTGNGSTDGPFVYLGFRPAFVMIKRTDTTANWQLQDKARLGYNPDNYGLFPNLTNGDYTTISEIAVDFLSNGFKVRTTDAGKNASGGTYIYMAFAENPTKYALAR